MSYDNKSFSQSGRCQPTFSNIRTAVVRPVHTPDCAFDQEIPNPEPTKEIGLIFEWDNGEYLAPNIPCHLSFGGETKIYGTLDGGKLFCQAPPGEYEAELLKNFNEEKKLREGRQKLKEALNNIIEHEKKEAAKLKEIQDGRSSFSNQTHLLLAGGRGFLYGAWGFIKSIKEASDLVNPFTTLSNALTSGWSAKRSDGKSWVQSYLDNFSEEQHRELAEALGFDYRTVTREKLAEAYEIACFIYDDPPSRQILGQFAKTYIDVQNPEEVMEFSGAIVFEIVLCALLIVFTGGVGLAARSALSVPLVGLLKLLGESLQELAGFIVNVTIKSAQRVKGMTGTGAITVTIRRPKPVRLNPIGIDTSALAKKIEDIRFLLKSDLKRSGNMATADIRIDGRQSTMAAHSGISNPSEAQFKLGIVGNVDSTFETFSVANKSGHMVERSGDSEVKILSNLAQQLGSNNKASGTVIIFTERPPCASCLNVAEQFKNRYPNIQIDILDNGGNMIRPAARP